MCEAFASQLFLTTGYCHFKTDFDNESDWLSSFLKGPFLRICVQLLNRDGPYIRTFVADKKVIYALINPTPKSWSLKFANTCFLCYPQLHNWSHSCILLTLQPAFVSWPDLHKSFTSSVKPDSSLQQVLFSSCSAFIVCYSIFLTKKELWCKILFIFVSDKLQQ